MANQTAKITLGIDIAKDDCVVYHWEAATLHRLPNTADAIAVWLDTLTGPVQLALEPTAHYHLAWVEVAQARGHAVYLVNPRALVHYREAVQVRNKTDLEDARLLARYLVHEAAQLRPWQPPCQQAQRLWALLKRRALTVNTAKQLQQSFAQIHLPAQTLFTQFRQLLARIDHQIQRLIQRLGWSDHYQRCRSIPGIGPLNAAALTAAFHRGTFASSDAFVAFLGLDVRLRESGRYTGQRKLTKRGEAELRRLLYCAAQPARCYPTFEQYYQRQLDKGLPRIAAKVVLARKLARIAFTLMYRQQMFAKKLTSTLAGEP